MNAPLPTFYTVGEAASAMRVSKMTVYRLIKSRELPAIRVGHTFRILAEPFQQYLTSGSGS